MEEVCGREGKGSVDSVRWIEEIRGKVENKKECFLRWRGQEEEYERVKEVVKMMV